MIWSLITELAAKLIPIFGNNYSKRNLQHYRKFYILFPDYSKVYEFVHNLNWTHIRRLLSVVNSEARMWYLKYASEEMWSTTTHNRNISSQYLIRGQKRVVDLTYFASFLVTMQWRMLLRHIFSTPRGKNHVFPQLIMELWEQAIVTKWGQPYQPPFLFYW